MVARFARLIEREIEKLVEDNDAENKKRSAKVLRQVFQEYFKEWKTTEREEKTLLARGSMTVLRCRVRCCFLRIHCCVLFYLRHSMYNKAIIEFGLS